MKSDSDSVAFMVVSCDKYADLWDPFFHCLRKYWPDCPYSIYLLTNHKSYDAEGVTVVNIGDDRSYSDNLRAALSQISEPWVILWLEDVFISEPVDTRRLQAMIEEAQSVPVGYLKLSPDLPLSYDNSSGQGIGPLPKGVRYRSAIGLSLYNVETLRKLLTPDASAWDLDKSTISNELEEPFYALTGKAARRPPIVWVNGVIKGQWNWPAITLLKKEGFSQLLEGRSRLGIAGFLYIQAFLLHNFTFRVLKKHWY
nr:hypothetical protein [uncultured Sphingomonas sp.]